jgi:hypothetical protein
MEFTAVQNFHSPELKSDYSAGLTYTARDPNEAGISPLAKKNRAILQGLLPQWLQAGKVVQGRVSVAPGTIGGAGKVG